MDKRMQYSEVLISRRTLLLFILATFALGQLGPRTCW